MPRGSSQAARPEPHRAGQEQGDRKEMPRSKISAQQQGDLLQKEAFCRRTLRRSMACGTFQQSCQQTQVPAGYNSPCTTAAVSSSLIQLLPQDVKPWCCDPFGSCSITPGATQDPAHPKDEPAGLGSLEMGPYPGFSKQQSVLRVCKMQIPARYNSSSISGCARGGVTPSSHAAPPLAAGG